MRSLFIITCNQAVFACRKELNYLTLYFFVIYYSDAFTSFRICAEIAVITHIVVATPLLIILPAIIIRINIILTSQ